MRFRVRARDALESIEYFEYLKEHNLRRLEGRKNDYDWPIDGTQPGAVKLEGEYGPDVACRFACDFIERHKAKPFFVVLVTVPISQAV